MIRRLPLFLTSLFLFCLSETEVQAQTPWRFKVIVGVEKQTAVFYETAQVKPIATIVREQFVKVNANFNRGNRFANSYNFSVDSIYIIQDSVQPEFSKPHPGFDFKVIVDASNSTANTGGWYETNRVIYQKWRNSEFGGPFEQFATDGLTRDLARGRGAVDLFGLQVAATGNPVNGQPFTAVNSIMTFPFNNVVWDDYTVSLLNRTAGAPITGKTHITSAFPSTLRITAKDSLGNNASGVRLDVYPVEWFSNAVTATPLLNTTTTATGQYTFATNPFAPNSTLFPYAIRYGNFLVKASRGATTLYQWMPLNEVQNKFFKDGAATPYSLDFVFPSEPASIRLNTLADSSFCPGERFQVEFTPSGVFRAGNYFKLQLSNASGSFASPITLGDSINQAPYRISATAPATFAAGSGYRLRIVSTNPRASSNEANVRLVATPSAPAVIPVEVCQNGTPPVLLPTALNLTWYRSDTASVGTTNRPVISTAVARDTTLFVSQAVLGCPSPRVALRVSVLPLARLSLGGTPTIFLGEQADLRLSFTGKPPYTYQLTNNLQGTATKDTTLKVSPAQTTTYKVVQISNSCGAGRAGSPDSLRVQVLRPSITTLGFSPLSLCPGRSFTVRFRVNGRFTAGTTYALQIAPVPDSNTPATFRELVSTSTSDSLITAAIPDTTRPGNFFVRVVARNPLLSVNGTNAPTILNLTSPPTASITSAGTTIFGGETTPITINFTGTGPWNFSYREVNDNSPGTVYSATALSTPYDLVVRPLKTTIYSLTSVSNACGTGPTTESNVTIRVIPLLSAPNPVSDFSVEVFPLPTSANLTLRVGEYASTAPIQWKLYNILGQVVMQNETYEKVSELSLVDQPNGLYLLRIKLGDQIIVKRVMKQ